MIRIVLLGRTGNHLFQYALGRVLAEKHGVQLLLDASWFNAEGWAEVSHFLRLPIRAKVLRRLPLAARALRKFTGKHYWEYGHSPLFRENPDDQSFDPRFLDVPPDCLLFGYFQTPRYFESIAEEFRREIKNLLHNAFHAGHRSPPEQAVDVMEALPLPNSVAVHVRRQDYLTHPAFQVCDLSYYDEAIKRMRTGIQAPRFFIFSDDPGWCRTHFTAADHHVIDSYQASRNPLHDLHLMSLASHHIIANSTYSWWAAWLAMHPDQQVLMPDRWYAGNGIKAPVEEKKLPHWKTITWQEHR